MSRLCPCGEAASLNGWCDDCNAYNAEKRAERASERVTASSLPDGLHGQAYPSTPEAHAARRWGAGELSTLTLLGPAGVGKTRLAAAAIWDRLQRGPARWVSVSSMMLDLRAGFGDEARAKALAALTGDTAVVLDDLDKANPTEEGRSAVFTAINNRLEAGSPVLVTTNLELSAIGKRYGEAVKSRLAGGQVVKLLGEDRRLVA